jgi:hypothetical protein
VPTPANKDSGHGERIDTNQAMENVLEEVGGEPRPNEATQGGHVVSKGAKCG